MEKKTIGRFIAALRKANGLTQRELAEKLSVSDKAVSRWERDESAPDLTLIPVIAEIFGVSADELLRGERATAPAPSGTEGKTEGKSEKQLSRLLEHTKTSFRVRSICASGLALAGLLGAMICNFGFNRAYIGFFVACVFYLAAAVCEAVFMLLAFSALGREFEGDGINACKCSLVSVALRAFSVTVVLLAATLPLIVFPRDTFMGLRAGSWLSSGAIFAAAALALCLLAGWIVRAGLQKRGLSALSESQRKKNGLKAGCAAGTAAVMVLTLALHLFLTSDYVLYTETTVFDNYEDFIVFMREPKEWMAGHSSIGSEAPVPVERAQEDAVTWYDENGNAVQNEWEAKLRSIENPAGETVCRYLAYNEQVVRISYPATGTCLPITVITQQQMRAAQRTVTLIGWAFTALYPLEAAAGVLLYFRKKRKL